MKIPQRTETADSAARLKRAHELDARVTESFAVICAGFANTTKNDFPPDWVDQSGFEQFIKSRGIILTSADKTGLLVLGTVFGAGAILSPQTIFDVLTKFNPARNAEAVNA
jgi:hypothetical protein